MTPINFAHLPLTSWQSSQEESSFSAKPLIPSHPIPTHPHPTDLGTFPLANGTLQLIFFSRQGFEATIQAQDRTYQAVELTAPFLHIQEASAEQLAHLAQTLPLSYSITANKGTDGLFRVKFSPKLLGGGNKASKGKEPASSSPRSSKAATAAAKQQSTPPASPKSTKADKPVILNLSEIHTTEELADSLLRMDKSCDSYPVFEKLALRIIDAYGEHSYKTPAFLKEMTMLARGGNRAISHEILRLLFTQIQAAPLLDIDHLQALRDTLKATDPTQLDPDDLVNILRTLCLKYDSFHKQESTLSKQYQLIYTLSEVLDAMGDANVNGLSYDSQHDPLYRQLNDLASHEDWQIAAQASYAKEALYRVGHDKSKLALYLQRACSLLLGVNHLKQVITQKEVTLLFAAFNDFKEAMHSQGKQHSWFDELRLMLALKELGQIQAFEDYFKSKRSTLPENERPHFLMGINNALIEIMKHDPDTIRLEALRFLHDLYLDEASWGSMNSALVKLHMDSGEKVVTKVRVGILTRLKEWSCIEDGEFTVACRSRLEQIQKGSKSSMQKNWLKEAGIPSNLKSLKITAKAEHLVTEPSTDLLNEAKIKPKMIPELIRSMRQSYLNDPDIKELLSTYIAPTGARDLSYQLTFPLEEEVQKFFAGDKKVLLLLGGAGAGKTTLGKRMVSDLWQKWVEGAPIPIFIPLGGISEYKRMIEETLANYEFSAAQITQLKKENSFLLILDGYDEMVSKPNLYRENKLNEWNAKVMITCRPTLFAKGDFNALFTPYKNDMPQHALFQEVYTAPFSDSQIDEYLKQYITRHPTSIWDNYMIYKEHINKISGLPLLIQTPFLLYITAEVLPDIMQSYAELESTEKLELSKNKLFEAFIEKWFIRSEGKMGSKLDGFEGDIKLSLFAYCKKLAILMFKNEMVVIKYTPAAWGESSSQWEEFFTNEGITPLLRYGAPLQKIGRQEWAFLHQEIRDYFITRDM